MLRTIFFLYIHQIVACAMQLRNQEITIDFSHHAVAWTPPEKCSMRSQFPVCARPILGRRSFRNDSSFRGDAPMPKGYCAHLTYTSQFNSPLQCICYLQNSVSFCFDWVCEQIGNLLDPAIIPPPISNLGCLPESNMSSSSFYLATTVVLLMLIPSR